MLRCHLIRKQKTSIQPQTAVLSDRLKIHLITVHSGYYFQI